MNSNFGLVQVIGCLSLLEFNIPSRILHTERKSLKEGSDR